MLASVALMDKDTVSPSTLVWSVGWVRVIGLPTVMVNVWFR